MRQFRWSLGAPSGRASAAGWLERALAPSGSRGTQHTSGCNSGRPQREGGADLRSGGQPVALRSLFKTNATRASSIPATLQGALSRRHPLSTRTRAPEALKLARASKGRSIIQITLPPRRMLAYRPPKV